MGTKTATTYIIAMNPLKYTNEGRQTHGSQNLSLKKQGGEKTKEEEKEYQDRIAHAINSQQSTNIPTRVLGL